MPVLGAASSAGGRSGFSSSSNANSTNTDTIAKLQAFLSEFREHEAFLYRDRLRANLLRKEWTLEVDITHLIGWNEELAARCRTEPGDVVPLVRCFHRACCPRRDQARSGSSARRVVGCELTRLCCDCSLRSPCATWRSGSSTQRPRR